MTPLLALCLVTSVHDGDTFTCSTREVVRIGGIEAPELPGSSACRKVGNISSRRCDFSAGFAARDHARAIIASSRRVEIERLGKDPWCRRTVARVYVDGRDLGSMLVASNHAWEVRVYARKDCR